MTENLPDFLYHYTSISTLASILKNETIKFNNLTKVDDLEESKYSPFGKYVFVSCWTSKVDEDIPTWIMYGNKMNGVRIKLPIYPFKVNYLAPADFDKRIPPQMKKHINIDINDTFFNIDDFINNNGYMISPSNSPTSSNKYDDCYKNILFRVDYTSDEKQLNYSLLQQQSIRKGDFLVKMGFHKRECWSFQSEWRYKIVFVPSSVIDCCIDFDALPGNILRGRNLPFENYFMKLEPKYFEKMEITMGPCTTDGDRYIIEELLKSKSLNPQKIVRNSNYFGNIRNFV